MISTKIQLRFSDFDMGNHVHNAAYLNYFESARIGFFMKGLGQDVERGWSDYQEKHD